MRKDRFSLPVTPEPQPGLTCARAHRIAECLQSLLLHTYPRTTLSGVCGIEGLGWLAGDAQKAWLSPSVTPMEVETLANPAGDGRIGRSIFEAARAFAGGAFHDDACLLVGRRSLG